LGAGTVERIPGKGFDTMIVILTEEESMTAMIDTLIESNWPNSVNGVDWICLSFQGKSDLEKNIPRKMQQWNFGQPKFLILRDQDGADCIAVKRKLQKIAEKGEKPFLIRIVCMELESWLLGELDAVEAAYPASKASKLRNKEKYRNPDKLANASHELSKLVGTSGKVGRARAIAIHFLSEKCVSKPFKVFWQSLSGSMNA